MSITWVDDVTPLDAVNMNKLEQTVRKGAANGYLGLNAGGNGFTLVDASITRVAANDLKTSGIFRAVSQIVASDASPQATIIGSVGPAGEGGVKIGAAGDTNLYRSAANTLKTDGSVIAGVNFQTFGGSIYFGSAGDANFYRSGAGQLRSDGGITGTDSGGVALGIRKTGDTAWRMYGDGDGTLRWGNGSGTYNVRLQPDITNGYLLIPNTLGVQ